MTAEEELKSFIAGISGFANKGHADKIRVFAWLQHHLFRRERFQTSDINACYNVLSYAKTSTSTYLAQMEGKELLRDRNGYYCEGKFRARYDELYGEHDITLNVRQMVKDLVNLLPELGEQDIMKEALICLRHDAGRAATIMVWNIGFYHLCQYVLKHKLKEFNDRCPVVCPKKFKVTDLPIVQIYEDFAEHLTERQVIEICNSASIITSEMFRVYKEKLDRRNSAAHPSKLRVTQIQAEGYIDDLLRNTVLQLPI